MSNTINVQNQTEETEKPSGAKKVFGVIRTVFVWIVVIFSIAIMIFTVTTSLMGNSDRTLFGLRIDIVLSDSMKATDFASGDLIISKAMKIEDCDDLKEGDIITYVALSSVDDGFLVHETGTYITHKIRSRAKSADGAEAFVTYGTTTGVNDESLVEYSQVVGKYLFRIPSAGYFFNFLKTTPGFISCILVPFLILIGIQGISVVRAFRKYKAEQTNDILAEKAQIASERAETQRLMEELMLLKAQLQGNGQQQPSATEDVPESATPVNPETNEAEEDNKQNDIENPEENSGN